MMTRRRALIEVVKSGGGLPSDYQQVTYVANTHFTVAYIDTGIYPTNNTKIEIGVNMYSSAQNRPYQYFVGSKLYQPHIGQSYLEYKFGGTTLVSTAIQTHGNYYYSANITFGNGKYVYTYSGGTEEITLPETTFTDNTTLLLVAGRRGSSGTVESIYCRQRKNVYYLNVYENNTLVREYIPVYRKSDGEIGFYDLCGSICASTNSPFYINVGTGTFEKGADVTS